MATRSFLVYGVPILGAAYMIVTLTGYFSLRDTWERDNKTRILALAKKLDSKDEKVSLAAANEILDVVGNHELTDLKLIQALESARVHAKAHAKGDSKPGRESTTTKASPSTDKEESRAEDLLSADSIIRADATKTELPSTDKRIIDAAKVKTVLEQSSAEKANAIALNLGLFTNDAKAFYITLVLRQGTKEAERIIQRLIQIRSINPQMVKFTLGDSSEESFMQLVKGWTLTDQLLEEGDIRLLIAAHGAYAARAQQLPDSASELLADLENLKAKLTTGISGADFAQASPRIVDAIETYNKSVEAARFPAFMAYSLKVYVNVKKLKKVWESALNDSAAEPILADSEFGKKMLEDFPMASEQLANGGAIQETGDRGRVIVLPRLIPIIMAEINRNIDVLSALRDCPQ